jgi:general secretion pathway protein F
MQEAAARGERASAALQDYGGGQAQLLAGVIAAGESSGRLAEALDVAAAAFTRSAELKARLGGALIYPGFVIAATCATLASFLIFVVPTLGQAFEGSEAKLPASTLSILHLSAWLRGEGGLDILAGLACVVLALITPAVRARLGVVAAHAALSPLGMGVAERLACSAFASLAALSLQAGVPVPQAFEAGARAQTNPVTRRRLSAVAAAIRSGEAPSVALERNGGAPRAFVRLARLGEETGSLGETLKEAGVLLSAEAEQRLERLSAIAGPVVTLALGGLVASVVMSLFLGLLSLSDMALA